MKLFSILALATLGFTFEALAQQCEGHLIDNRNRVVEVFRGNICKENLKACSLAARKTGLRCDRVDLGNSQPRPDQNPPHRPDQYPRERLPLEVERMNEVEMAKNYALEGCHVLSNVSGWADQLFVDGQFMGNYDSSQQMQLQRAIRDLQARGQCRLKDIRTLNVQFRPSLIEEAINYSLSRNCHVLPQVSGWSNQLFVNDQFVGNFDPKSSSEQMKLRGMLANYLSSGKCIERSYEERRLLQDPNLIRDFINFQYRGCHVKQAVGGWSNQLYVGNQFRGNFDQNNESKKLQKTLVELIMNGTCQFDPFNY